MFNFLDIPYLAYKNTVELLGQKTTTSLSINQFALAFGGNATLKITALGSTNISSVGIEKVGFSLATFIISMVGVGTLALGYILKIGIFKPFRVILALSALILLAGSIMGYFNLQMFIDSDQEVATLYKDYLNGTLCYIGSSCGVVSSVCALLAIVVK